MPLSLMCVICLHACTAQVWWGLVLGYGAMTAVMVVFVLRSQWVALSEEAQNRSEKDGALVGGKKDGTLIGGEEGGGGEGSSSSVEC